MTQANMTTFTDVIKGRLMTSEKVCDKHGINLIYLSSAPDKQSCFKCAKEAVEKETDRMARAASDAYMKRDTYDWLMNRSIVVEKKILKATFDNYKTMDKETEINKELALKFAREYYKGATYNTIFSGKAGTGKSHLAMAMLKAINENSNPYHKCLFVAIGEMINLVKDSFRNKESENTELFLTNLLIEADFLVVDDIGAEVGSINSNDEASDFVTKILKKVFEGRDEKPTIITTNLTANELKEKYDQRVFSRMHKGVLGEVKKFIVFKETTDKRMYDGF